MNYIFNYIKNIPYDELSHLVINGYEFYWNGQDWELVK